MAAMYPHEPDKIKTSSNLFIVRQHVIDIIDSTYDVATCTTCLMEGMQLFECHLI